MIYIFDFYKFLNEKRSNPELNKKTDLYQFITNFIEKNKGQEELLFIHFSNIIKPQHINKKYEWHFSPMGLYLYPLSNPYNNSLQFIDNTDIFENIQIESSIENARKTFNILLNDFKLLDYNTSTQFNIKESVLYSLFTIDRFDLLRFLNNEDISTETIRKSDYIFLKNDNKYSLYEIDNNGLTNLNVEVANTIIEDYYLKLILKSLISNNIVLSIFDKLYDIKGNSSNMIKQEKELLDKLEIKSEIKKKYSIISKFAKFSDFKYVYLFKLKSLENILINETCTKEQIIEISKKVEQYTREKLNYTDEDLEWCNFQTSISLHELYKRIKEDIIFNLPKERKSKEMFNIFKYCGVAGIMTYDNSFIDDTIKNQLALFDTSLIEYYRYHENDTLF